MERTILLVDDEEDNIAALARMLRLDTYKILCATNGMEGLALLDEHEVGAHLQELGCNEAQEYLFSRPVPANEMTMLLQRGVNLELITGE